MFCLAILQVALLGRPLTWRGCVCAISPLQPQPACCTRRLNPRALLAPLPSLLWQNVVLFNNSANMGGGVFVKDAGLSTKDVTFEQNSAAPVVGLEGGRLGRGSGPAARPAAGPAARRSAGLEDGLQALPGMQSWADLLHRGRRAQLPRGPAGRPRS